MSHSLMSTYKRLPVTFARGEGALLWDTQDKQYLDALSGVAVCNLGHAHPAVTRAVCEQAGRLLHTSNIYGIAAQEALGDTLTALAGMDRVFFGNSGAEANEAAIKLARLYGHRRGTRSPMIVVMENSFHGRTLATLSATGNRKVQAGFEPLVQGFIRVPYGDLAALQAVADNQQDVVAVLVEPIQGEGGVNVPPADYLPGVRALCDSKDWLMILDEIQTGMGRTGKPFAYQHYDFKPDVMTLAKALGNGVPIGACLARGETAELFAPGNHGSTFGGNPLACAAALTVCKTLSEQQLWDTAASLGEHIMDGLRHALANVRGVIEVRGQGLMIGIALDRPCAELVGRALEQGLLINVTADSVVRLLPPLVMSEQQADHLVSLLSSLLREFVAGK
ncbi:MAG: aspartate aminotransferase family protein [Sedimenticolaceae bacterium]|nr:aspartate aminotransferase family protein [Chromatiaceae bacterium]HPE79009.1 aspartate aminotransferase family protein [Gammaproteobacteria bacterium]